MSGPIDRRPSNVTPIDLNARRRAKLLDRLERYLGEEDTYFMCAGLSTDELTLLVEEIVAQLMGSKLGSRRAA